LPCAGVFFDDKSVSQHMATYRFQHKARFRVGCSITARWAARIVS